MRKSTLYGLLPSTVTQGPTYPTERYLQQIPHHIYVGLGFHPKHAKNIPARTEDEVHQFQRLIKNPRVVAFGEIGLDHSKPMKYWAYQVELLQMLLPFLEDRFVLSCGFTNLVNMLDDHHIAAFCSLEESRLLLESDSPYFPIKDSKVSSPSQLWAVAAAVASHRQLTPERVLEVSPANGQHLYCGQQ